MPAITSRPIQRLNEERLLYGLLPTPWFLAYMPLAIIVLMVRIPRGLVDGLIILAVLAGLMLIMMAIHRVSRARIIAHWFKWQLSGRGAVAGRDLYPIPHRFQDMDDDTLAYVRAQVKEDRLQAKKMQGQVQSSRNQEQKELRAAQAHYRKEETQRQRNEKNRQRA